MKKIVKFLYGMTCFFLVLAVLSFIWFAAGCFLSDNSVKEQDLLMQIFLAFLGFSIGAIHSCVFYCLTKACWIYIDKNESK